MTIQSFDTIRSGQTMPPQSEIALANYVAKWRRLYRRDFAGYAIEDIGTGQPGPRINWFRRTAQFYGEFMFGERPTVEFDNNARIVEPISPMLLNLLPEMQAALIDMVRFGQGIVATHPRNPEYFVRFERDQHIEVENVRGEIEGDVFWRVRHTGRAGDDEASITKLVDVYKYPISGPAVWEVYNFTGAAATGGLGALRLRENLPPRAGRQALIFEGNRETTSMFEDMEDSIAEMSRTLSRVGFSIRRNLRPHLYAPAGSILTEDGSNVRINEKGMIFPIDSGDITPGYLQWDSRSETVNYYYNTLRSLLFNMAGLSELLFDPQLFTGALSGEALRRLMIPFYSRLRNYETVLNTVIEDAVMVWNQNRQANGQEVFDINRQDIRVTWPFDALFTDAEVTPAIEPGPIAED